MSSSLRILMVEDLSTDAELVERELRLSPMSVETRWVDSRDSFLAALDSFLPDIVLSDYSMPQFDGMQALDLLRERSPHTPFIIITGSMNEETAVECIKAGADDYVIKEHLQRLVPAISSAVDKRRIMRLKDEAERNLVASERRFRTLIESVEDVVFTLDTDLRFTGVFGRSADRLRLAEGQALGRRFDDVMTTDAGENHRAALHACLRGGIATCEWSMSVDAVMRHYATKLSPIKDGAGTTTGIVGLIHDVTDLKNTQNELSETSEFLANLFTHASGPIIVMNPDRTIIRCNLAFEHFIGAPASEIAGVRLAEFFPEDARDDILKVIVPTSSGETWKSVEVPFICRDGSTKIALWNSANIYDNDGRNIVAIVAQGQDISERKRDEDKLRQLSRAIDQSPATIMITDRDGLITYVNPKFSEVTGYSCEEVLGRNPRFLKSGETCAEEYEALWKTILSGLEWRGEFHNKRKDGSLFWETASISPIADDQGVVRHFVAVKEDSTAKKGYENEILRARAKAEESDKVKSSLLANMSHEFRTPINGIMGFGSLLLDDPDNEDREEMIRNIMESGERLLNTLDAILTIAQLEGDSYRVRMHDIAIDGMVAHVVARFEERVARKNLTLTTAYRSPGLVVSADNDLLEDAVARLLENAVKFTRSGGIEIAVCAERRDGRDHAAIRVSDTGIGVAHHDRERIYEPFRQSSEGLGRKYEGTGLGLTIVKRSATLFGGVVELDDNQPRGSVFTLVLPCVTPTAPPPHGTPTRSAGRGVSSDNLDALIGTLGRPPLLLIVEDNEANTMLAAAILRKYCIVEIAEDGESAVSMSLEKTYDLVLMDINLGAGIDGIESTRRIRNNPSYRRTPFAALTGYTLREDRRQFLAQGLQFYLAKPFSRDQLLRLVGEMISAIIPS